MMPSTLNYHPVYLGAAIGCGAMGVSWMNDSGFWIFAKMGGLTEGETLKAWTGTVCVMGITGFITTLVLAWIVPFAQ